jgi:hypothetical protein
LEVQSEVPSQSRPLLQWRNLLGLQMSDTMTAQDLANKLWRLLPEVSDKDTIYQAVEFLQDLDKD